MRESTIPTEQITMTLRQAQDGTPMAEICCALGVNDVPFYRWKKRRVSPGVSEIRELTQLREENQKSKGLMADLSPEKVILQKSLRRNI